MGKQSSLRSKVRDKREEKKERRRQHRGDPLTRKVKTQEACLSVSGKRKRKLLKKWRREQKDALDTGLVTVEEIQAMMIDGQTPQDNKAEEVSKATDSSASKRFRISKKAKLRMKKSTGKKKGKAVTKTSGEGDKMIE